ncbi:ATP-binding protein [Nocardioides caeni]|uniref:ATP-binding protein n=1 Tax=Nocardioides caeni TaxID=574700 RepID=UPI00130547D0|nr:LuxR family transcriptional regulator [Nocardioides caeni]
MRSPVLVSRTAELARLGTGLAALSGSRGSVWCVLGDPGIGKSRLVATVAADAASAGVTVLTGRAVLADTPAALRPLGEALLRWSRTAEVPDDAHLAPYLPALGRLVPQLGQGTDDGSAPVMLIAEGLLRLARALPGPGMLLVLEDLHWSDPETLEVLEYVADNAVDLPLMVVATARQHDTPAVTALMGALTARGAAETLTLGPLTPGEGAELARACLAADAPEELLAWVGRFGAGYPLFAEEILADLIDRRVLVQEDGAWHLAQQLDLVVPRPFVRSVEDRLSRAGGDAREVAAASAMLGTEFDWRVVAHATGLGEAAVADAFRELRAQRLVDIVVPDGFAFRHALTREAVLDGLLAPDRSRLAASLADALAVAGDGAPEPRLLAELAETAGEDERAAGHWLEAARQAAARGALTTALDAVGRARRLLPAGGVLDIAAREIEMGVHAQAGDVPRAVAAGEELVADLVDDPPRLAAARLRLTRALLAGGRWDEAAAALGAVTGHDPVEEAVLAARLALGRQDDRRAVEQARLALEVADGARVEVSCEAWEVLGRALRARDYVGAEEAFESGFRLADEHGLPLWRCRLLAALGALELAGRRPTEERLVAARAAALELGAIATAARIELELNLVRLRYLDLAAAQTAIDNAIEMMARLRLPDLATAHLLRAATHGLAGEADQMEAEIERARSHPMDEGIRRVGVPGHVRGLVALAHGRHADALAQLGEAMTYHREVPSTPFSLRGLWALLETALTGDGADAREEIRSGPQSNSPHNHFALRYADAIALGREGRAVEAEQAFADAEWAMPGREPWLELNARFLVAGAAARDGWGDPERWFRHVLDGFVDYGLAGAASVCRVAMRDAGFAVPRKAVGSGRVPVELQRLGVTAREYDVLELVVTGLSNKDVAARLHLSVRTVETHVTRLLHRTGCADRAGLARLVS